MFTIKRLMFVVALVASATFIGNANAKRIAIPVPPKPAIQALQADVIVLGKVTEIEKDTVEATPFKGAPKDQKIAYKIAVLKITDPLMGAKGLTQLRVGFPADAQPAPADGNDAAAPPRPIRGGFGPIALTAGMEGCFFLAPHHDGDFYVLPQQGGVVNKKDENYTKALEEIKGVVKALDDPMAALKAKEKNERAAAVQTLLTYYRGRPLPGPFKEVALSTDENKLLLQTLAEMPWQADPSDPTKPSRGNLWYFIQPEKYGFKPPMFQPQRPGDPPIDYNKVWDETTAKFLKDNMDKIKISKMVAGK